MAAAVGAAPVDLEAALHLDLDHDQDLDLGQNPGPDLGVPHPEAQDKT